jgi:hypothetical protein
MADRTMKQVVTPFSVGNEVFGKGELMWSDDPIVKKHAEYFGEAKVHESAPIEQATAAPGEKRQTRRRTSSRKSTAKKTAKKVVEETEGEPSPHQGLRSPDVEAATAAPGEKRGG